MDEVDLAIADFNKAIAEEPGYANAFRNRGRRWLQQRSFDRANEDFDKASRLSRQASRFARAACSSERARRRCPAGTVVRGLPKLPHHTRSSFRHHFENHDVARVVSPVSSLHSPRAGARIYVVTPPKRSASSARSCTKSSGSKWCPSLSYTGEESGPGTCATSSWR